MQAIPVIAGILLVGLMAVSGFQLVPESALGGTTTSLNGGGVQIDSDVSNPAPRGELFSGSITEIEPVITTVSIKRPQDIERQTATLRGRIVVGPEELGAGFFVYGYSRSDVERVTHSANSYQAVLDNIRSGIYTKRVSNTIRRTDDVSVRVGGLAVDATYYVRLCVEVGAQLRCSTVTDFQSLEGPNRVSEVRIPTIQLRGEEAVSGEEVILSLSVDMRDTDDGRVYLVYGESRSAVTEAIKEEYGDIDERGDRLQKTRLATGVIGSREFTTSIDDLDDETDYYYATCVSYDGLRDGFVCTRLNSFTTPGDSFGESPRVSATDVSVSGNTIALAGSVTMRSFRNARAFFVYGTDSDAINRVSGERSMDSIRQNGDRLQRVLVEGDINPTKSFRVVVPDLRFATPYVARLCVEFENKDERGRDQMYVECGEVREFTTN